MLISKWWFYSLDLGEVLVEHNTLVEFEERKKAEELAKQAAVEPEPTPVVETPVAEAEQEIAVDTPEPLQQIDFRVWVNENQKAALKHFLVSNGIRYGSVR